ncbi:MAG: hypothetical protein ACK5LN_04915 [Propioniciclava sp.]
MSNDPAGRVLVVDAANVVGSRPDGWWADRAGAAGRLVAGLVHNQLGFDRLVIVLEGRARAGAAVRTGSGVDVIHAPASGDDEIVRQCERWLASGEQVWLASADRGLLDRVTFQGVTPLGPRQVRDTAMGT